MSYPEKRLIKNNVFQGKTTLHKKNRKYFRKYSQTAMKFVYLCSVEIEEENNAQASAKLFSGLTEFAGYPGRRRN